MNCSRCRARLAGGSRFCNSCGSPVLTGAPAAPPPGMPPPPVAAHSMHAAPGQAAAVLPRRRKAPMWLFAMLGLLAALAATAGIMMASSGGRSVLGNLGVPLPAAPSVAHGSSPAPPPGAPVVAGVDPAPAPGAPVVGGSSPSPDLAPPLTVANGARPAPAPSVIQGGQPAAPPKPAVIAGANPAPAPAPPVVGARPTQPPAPRDNSDFDRYLRWLQKVENFRNGLRARGETQSFRVIEQFYQSMLGLSDPMGDDMAIQRNFQANLQRELQAVVHDINLTWQNINRTKPPVPVDCRALDEYYMRAVRLEGEQTIVVMNALQRKDIGAIKAAGRIGVAQIDQNLGFANRELEEVFEQRGLNQLFRIETGGKSSMLGGLMGLGM